MLHVFGRDVGQSQRENIMTSNNPALCGRVWNGTTIRQRVSDGYVNATAMCKANGREWFTYARAERSREYIVALAASLGSPQNCGDLIRTITSGPNEQRGTWVHPRLAIDLARWISPAFAVWMDGWFLDWINNGHASKAEPSMTYADLRAMSPAQQAARWITLAVEEYENNLRPELFGEVFICQMASALDSHFRRMLPVERRPKRNAYRLPSPAKVINKV